MRTDTSSSAPWYLLGPNSTSMHSWNFIKTQRLHIGRRAGWIGARPISRSPSRRRNSHRTRGTESDGTLRVVHFVDQDLCQARLLPGVPEGITAPVWNRLSPDDLRPSPKMLPGVWTHLRAKEQHHFEFGRMWCCLVSTLLLRVRCSVNSYCFIVIIKKPNHVILHHPVYSAAQKKTVVKDLAVGILVRRHEIFSGTVILNRWQIVASEDKQTNVNP